MRITDIARLFDRDPDLISDEYLHILHDTAMRDVASWTLKCHANNPAQPREFAAAVERYNAYAEEQFKRSDYRNAARKVR